MTIDIHCTPHVVWHVAGMGHWKEVVYEQLTLLREAGLHKHVRATYLGDEESWFLRTAETAGVNVELVASDPNLAHCETLAVLEVERLAKGEHTDRPVLYFHTKGVSNPGDWRKQRWRHLMQEWTVRRWQLNLHYLLDHDAVGVNWIQGGDEHFSGTFWIAHPDWLRQLPSFSEYHAGRGRDRYSCEMWIGAKKWCNFKSLAAKNQPFWSGTYDFDALLPPTVQGGFDYRGTPASQHPRVVEVLPRVLRELSPARVIEIGTGDGGFARLIRTVLNTSGMSGVPVTTIDVTEKPSFPRVREDNIEVVVDRLFNFNFSDAAPRLIELVRAPGKTVVFCDGAVPPKEFSVVARYAKVGDVVLAHDYAPNETHFNRLYRGQVWDWLETTDAMISPAVERYGMTRVFPEELQSAVWCGYAKGVDPAGPVNALTTAPSVRGKIGLGIVTHNRPAYFERAMERVAAVADRVDAVYVYNDGSTDRDYYRVYGTLPDKIKVCHADTNRGVGHAKNQLLNSMLAAGCEYLFVMEDDILIRDGGVFAAYISAHVPGAVEHLNFAHHGPANAGGPVGAYSERVALYPNVVGAFSFYTANCVRRVGVMAPGFRNAWEHVEHTARIADAGLTTPFWQFADLADSRRYLEDIPESIANSTIRKDDAWKANIRDGLLYWKTQLSTTFPEALNQMIDAQ